MPKEPKRPTVSTRILLSKASTSTTDVPSRSIRIDRPFPLPLYVKDALQRLDDAGHVAYLVGGCVRDFLLEKESKDYDIATSALPDTICDLFPDSVIVGKAFGVIKVPVSHSTFLEIATFRKDLDYHDSRRPKGIVFSNPLQDALRRDFTINALFYDPKSLRILDFTGGLSDLKEGIIRAIGNPSHRFREDALRLLRAVRFKTRFGFRLDGATAEAIRARARLISKISMERVRDELTSMWLGPRPDQCLELLSELGLLSFVLPEVEALKGIPQIPVAARKEDVWKHLLRALKFLSELVPGRSKVLAWAMVLHEVEKSESSKDLEKISNRLRLSREESKKISMMVADHLKLRDVFKMRESTLQRFIREEHFEELLSFHKADVIASDGNLAFFEFCSKKLDLLKRMPPEESYPLLDGKDLIQLGLLPGPGFTEILQAVEDLSLEKKITTKEEALEYVIKEFVK